MKKLVFLLLFCVLDAQIYITKDKLLLEKSLKSWVAFKNDNLIRQHYDYSCGSASLATILKYYYNELEVSEQGIIEGILKSKGYSVSQNEILKEGDNVISFLDLSTYVSQRGLKAIGLGVDFQTLSKLKIPAIVFVNIRNIGHFSVYKGMDDKYVYLADPSFGNIKIKLGRFEKMFYQRKDSQYRGKILIVLPQKESLKANKDFMNLPPKNILDRAIYENLPYPKLYR